MQSGSGKGYNAQINVTPLVDVVLVLLIIFMVVTPMMQKHKAVELPEAQNVATKKSEREQLFVAITDDEKIWVENDEVASEAVEDVVRARLRFNPGLELIVKGDKKLGYGKVRSVMLACRRAGAKRVVLASKERKEPGA